MSALDWVTIKTDIEGISHNDEHYQTKDMALWGGYLIDEEGLLFRKDDNHPEWTRDTYTGCMSLVGDTAGYYVATFDEGVMTRLIHLMYSTLHNEDGGCP